MINVHNITLILSNLIAHSYTINLDLSKRFKVKEKNKNRNFYGNKKIEKHFSISLYYLIYM